jgi:hypothetical protein
MRGLAECAMVATNERQSKKLPANTNALITTAYKQDLAGLDGGLLNRVLT